MCTFCKIVAGEIPSTKVFEDDKILAFKDIEPQAPVHIVIIPKEHIESANDVNSQNSGIIAHIFEAVPKIAKEAGVEKSGYRIINNCGSDGGQSVPHLHFHMMGGRQCGWPAG